MIPRRSSTPWACVYWCVLALLPQHARASEQAVTPPQTITYEEKELRYDPLGKNQETYLLTNLDDDPESEVIISFAASYKPRPPQEAREDVKPPAVQKRVIPVIEHYSFFQIYDAAAGGRYRLAKTLHGMGRIGTVTLIHPAPEEPPVMVFVSPGGETYADVSVYQWRNHGYRRLLNEGGKIETISLDAASQPPSLQIEKRRYAWDKGQKTFVLK